MSAQELPTSILRATTILHIVFLPIAAGLLAFLVYLYFVHPRRPREAVDPFVAAPRSHDPRPRSLLPLLIAAAFTGMLSHVLNALYISQSLPRSANLDLHIPSLAFTPWLILMTSATIIQHLPVALLVAAIFIVLRERYHALLRRVNDKGDWVPGPFLGWVGKESASMVVTYMLFLFPIASRVAISLGLALDDSPYFPSTTTTPDFSSWDRMVKLAIIFDNCRVIFLAIAVFDIGISSYSLYKEGGFWGISDRVRLISVRSKVKQLTPFFQITAAHLHLVAPLLTAQAVQAIVSASLVTATDPAMSTLSTLDLASTSIVSATTYPVIALLTFLFYTPHRWDLQITPDSTVIRLGPLRLSEGGSDTLVSREYLETPKSVVLRQTI